MNDSAINALKLEIDDFTEAAYTAIVSDLHLCEEEPMNVKYPLWKKFKTRQFFFDEEFNSFLHHIVFKAKGGVVELILNGDIFDFDSLTTLPENPTFRITWLEKRRGLHPQEDKSCFKIDRILTHHKAWVEGLRSFLLQGHRVVFIIGNHDLEMHFPEVKRIILKYLDLPDKYIRRIRFNEWFYISNRDTLIEHGNQYDAYCMAQDPVNPFIRRFNQIEVRVPFGNLATRYMINGMGFFNPHVDSNFLMSAKEYTVFFFRYMLRAEPFLIWTWFWGAVIILIQASLDRLRPSLKDPLGSEDRVEYIAAKSNSSPRIVRELKELFVAPAASEPLVITRELWLDRAFLLLLAFLALFQLFIYINNFYSISFFWIFIPLSAFLPFFLFYTKTVTSDVISFKEPKERIMRMISLITKTSRVVFGHTHVVRHEHIGGVEHLNSGSWSPAFRDVECEVPIDQKTYVWIWPEKNKLRQAKVYKFKEGREYELF